MAENLYAGSSVQVFADSDDWPNLGHTHEDAAGFLDYVARFHALNFRLKDEDVAQWRFDPIFDDADGWRGADSVRVFYHAGHGDMLAGGTFEFPMGLAWATRTSSFSNMMRFGDQNLRYLFLSTCESLRVTSGDDPWRTWHNANEGCRMIFGFGSTSLDWWAYGQNFFRIWNTGVSFSQAWQDASLALTHNQVVSSTACGSTAEEAQDRLWNERLFSGARVSDDWYWWRWAGISPDVDVEVQLGIGVPGAPLHFKAKRRREERASRVARRFDVRLMDAEAANPFDREAVGVRPAAVHSDDDTISVRLAEVDPRAEMASIRELRASADRVARDLDPDGRLDLLFDRFTSTFHAGAGWDGEKAEPEIADFTAHYRQRFDGVPAVMGGAGHVAVTLDRTGRPCRIVDRTVEVIETQREGAPADPAAAGHRADIHRVLDEAQKRRLDPCGRLELAFDPDQDEVGYRFTDGIGRLVARREVTVIGRRGRKAYLIEIPIGNLPGLPVGADGSAS
jgi:hypothetical protein